MSDADGDCQMGKKKPKYREEVERLIVAGHRAGVCDREGNSVDRGDGSFKAKPCVLRPTFRKIYPRNGEAYVVESGG